MNSHFKYDAKTYSEMESKLESLSDTTIHIYNTIETLASIWINSKEYILKFIPIKRSSMFDNMFTSDSLIMCSRNKTHMQECHKATWNELLCIVSFHESKWKFDELKNNLGAEEICLSVSDANYIEKNIKLYEYFSPLKIQELESFLQSFDPVKNIIRHGRMLC